MHYLAVDVGTSYTKAAVLDIERFRLGRIERVPSPLRRGNDHPLFHELDPREFVVAVRQVAERLLADTPKCRGVLLCGQMGGLVLTSPTGAPEGPYISWLDRRSTEVHPSGRTYFDLFRDKLGTEWPRRLGNEVRPGLPLPCLDWLSQHGGLPSSHVFPLTLPDFVAANLCGCRPVMERTGATGSIDVTSQQWPTELIEGLGLKHLDWPELVDFRAAVGECRLAGQDLPVYAAVGDHQCALAGTFLQPGELSINISTGSQVAMIEAPGSLPGEFQLRPFFDGAFLKTITNIPAGRALNALVRLLSELAESQQLPLADPWEYILDQASAAPDSELDVNLAFFPSPVSGPGRLGNLSEDNLSIGTLFRAAFAQMAEYNETFAARLSAERAWERVVFSGGLAQRSELLRELICRRLGPAHRVTKSTDDTLLGMMVLGRVIAGHEATVREAAQAVRLGIAESGAP